MLIEQNNKKKLFLLIFLGLFFSIYSSLALSADLLSTNVQFYRPFEADVPGQITIIPTETIQGECTRHSELDKRSDAWQCQSGERLLDPCFIKTYVKAESAVCPLSPWQSQAVIVDFRGQENLPANNNNQHGTLDMSSDDPWAIKLVDGTQCVLIKNSQTSNSFSINGQHVKYACDNQAFLLGHIQRCELLWKMLLLPSRDSHTLKTAEIATAWY